jgi:amidophosphoribosyltransferase
MPFVDELIAHGRSVDQICKEIGADKLIYQDLDDLIGAVKEGNFDISEFDTSCFSGKYVTGGVDDKFLQNLSKTRLRSNL